MGNPALSLLGGFSRGLLDVLPLKYLEEPKDAPIRHPRFPGGMTR